MPFPFIAVITALATGGTLVPHAAGGLIVSAAGGYVAGTYLSTTAIATLLSAATASAGAIGATLLGVGSLLWGSAGFLGTSLGATGIKGTLMSAGIISSTPLWVPIAGVSAALLAGAGGYLMLNVDQIIQKTRSVPPGQEAQFSAKEAKYVEVVLKTLHEKKLLPE